MEKTTTVLIVDDDDINIFSLSAVLKAKGYKIESASDGRMAIEFLKSNPIVGIVLMDVMMPIMDGYEATRLIKMDEQLTNIPIISLTAKAMVGDKEKSMEAGANDYCSKPVNIDELIIKMNSCLKK